MIQLQSNELMTILKTRISRSHVTLLERTLKQKLHGFIPSSGAEHAESNSHYLVQLISAIVPSQKCIKKALRVNVLHYPCLLAPIYYSKIIAHKLNAVTCFDFLFYRVIYGYLYPKSSHTACMFVYMYPFSYYLSQMHS